MRWQGLEVCVFLTSSLIQNVSSCCSQRPDHLVSAADRKNAKTEILPKKQNRLVRATAASLCWKAWQGRPGAHRRRPATELHTSSTGVLPKES